MQDFLFSMVLSTMQLFVTVLIVSWLLVLWGRHQATTLIHPAQILGSQLFPQPDARAQSLLQQRHTPADEATVKAAQPMQLPSCHLLVVLGPDPDLQLDLVAFRRIRAHAHLRFTRLINVTSTHFEHYLERARMAKEPVRYLHLSVHTNGKEIQLADTNVTGAWLSERLLGVQILLLAGCHGDLIGDLLGVVPYVVTVMEEIDHHQARLLTEGFWSEIAEGMEPRQAFENALDRCPPLISEFAQLHVS
ncbi:MAG: hypothetical protein U0175_34395 [Caldilineaceae bacterium]